MPGSPSSECLLRVRAATRADLPRPLGPPSSLSDGSSSSLRHGVPTSCVMGKGGLNTAFRFRSCVLRSGLAFSIIVAFRRAF
eukprot:158045-Alexandrium_andersonii.AAC.1